MVSINTNKIFCFKIIIRTSYYSQIAVILMLAHPYGYPRIMSSYNFSNPNQGPPNLNCSIISPIFNTSNGQCINGWVCEHRWPEFYRMVKFRNLVHGLCLENWWSNGTNQIAFSRGNKGFIVVNLDVEIGDILSAKLQTGLPPGIYCDIITGDLINGNCTGKSVVVDAQGFISINLLPGSCLVIYIGVSMISTDKPKDNKYRELSKFLYDYRRN